MNTQNFENSIYIYIIKTTILRAYIKVYKLHVYTNIDTFYISFETEYENIYSQILSRRHDN